MCVVDVLLFPPSSLAMYGIGNGSIENMVLMQEKDFETAEGPRAPMDVATFYDSLETKRMARLDGLVQQYNSIESLLIKVG